MTLEKELFSLYLITHIGPTERCQDFKTCNKNDIFATYLGYSDVNLGGNVMLLYKIHLSIPVLILCYVGSHDTSSVILYDMI